METLLAGTLTSCQELLASGPSLVIAEKTDGTFRAKISLQALNIGVAQVDDDQPVENIGEFPVHIKREYLAADFQVLPKQDRKSFAIELEFRNGAGQLLGVTNQFVKCSNVPVLES